jgi:hypothetical protein
MKKKKRLFFFLKSVLSLNSIRRPGTIECRSLRLRISLLKRIRLPRIEDNLRGNYSCGEFFGYVGSKRDEGGQDMTIDSVILKLAPEDALRLTRILMDEDKEEAFQFLKECVKPQLDQAARGHIVRTFEER